LETPSPSNETPAFTARSQSTQARVEIISMEISTVMAKHREISDEEWELILMRYRQSIALTKLEDLFAQGLLDCM
jgi:hypothetical protein